MRKFKLVIFIFISAFMFRAQQVSASALRGPSCFVTAEVVEVSSETKKLDTGREYNDTYLNLKIMSIDKGSNCPVKVSEVFKVIDNNPGTFKKGDMLKAGVESASSMGPSGAVSFLQWSNLTYENGKEISSKYNNTIIDYLQSSSEPLVGNLPDDSSERDDLIQSNGQDHQYKYLFLFGSTFVLVGLLSCWFLYKRWAS